MGSDYHIVIKSERRVGREEREAISHSIQSELDRIDLLMSNWKSESEISRFNRHNSVRPFPVSEDTARVVGAALRVAHLTDGSFDPTIAGVINLWGFGSNGNTKSIPDPSQIKAQLQRSGYRKLFVNGNTLRKMDPALQVNLSGLAPGYAADRIFGLLRGKGFMRVMVEISGEIRTGGSAWKIGIERPLYDSNRSIQEIIEIGDLAVATSGDYRNFFIKEGRRFSHVLDPRTGWPVESKVISATVTGTECMMTDALATTMLVVGVERGREIIESLPGYGVMMIYESDGDLREFRSANFPATVSH
jgi:thiamine biosynthesis lipoprotein